MGEDSFSESLEKRFSTLNDKAKRTKMRMKLNALLETEEEVINYFREHKLEVQIRGCNYETWGDEDYNQVIRFLDNILREIDSNDQYKTGKTIFILKKDADKTLEDIIVKEYFRKLIVQSYHIIRKVDRDINDDYETKFLEDFQYRKQQLEAYDKEGASAEALNEKAFDAKETAEEFIERLNKAQGYMELAKRTSEHESEHINVQFSEDTRKIEDYYFNICKERKKELRDILEFGTAIKEIANITNRIETDIHYEKYTIGGSFQAQGYNKYHEDLNFKSGKVDEGFEEYKENIKILINSKFLQAENWKEVWQKVDGEFSDKFDRNSILQSIESAEEVSQLAKTMYNASELGFLMVQEKWDDLRSRIEKEENKLEEMTRFYIEEDEVQTAISKDLKKLEEDTKKVDKS